MTSSNSRRAEQLRARARRQAAAGQWRTAQATLEALMLRVPGDLSARLELARVLSRRGQWQASIQPLAIAPDAVPEAPPELVVELAKELVRRGESIQARTWLDTVERGSGETAAIWRACADLRAALGEVDHARELLERALADGADDFTTRHLYGLMLKFGGDLAAARDLFRQNLSRWPDNADSAIELAGITPEPDPVLLTHAEEALRRLNAGHSPEPGLAHAQAGFDYVRFRELDALDRREEAWSALCACNRRMQSLRPYPARAVAAVTDALLGLPMRARDDGSAGYGGSTIPIFIVGMPRSGTTLLERMLSAHSAVASAGEIGDFGTQLRVLADVTPGRPGALAEAVERAATIDFAQLGARYLEQTQWRAKGHQFLIDKLPQNIRFVGIIHQALPQARIVHIARDPMDVCFSNLAMMFPHAGAYSFSVASTAHYYRQYRRLASHWQDALPGVMLEVDYEELVSEPEVAMKRVCAYVGLNFERACLHPEKNALSAQSPSSVQVRAPVGTSRIGRWRRYAEPLRPLADALAYTSASGDP